MSTKDEPRCECEICEAMELDAQDATTEPTNWVKRYDALRAEVQRLQTENEALKRELAEAEWQTGTPQ